MPLATTLATALATGLSGLATLAAAQVSAPMAAETLDAELIAYRWAARPIVVFADDPADPRLATQLDRFERDEARLAERDSVVIVDANPGFATPLRRRFAPSGFTVVLVGKDGGEKYRRAGVVAVDALTTRIDAMPMRRREIEQRRASGN
ncbi:MAG: DUF4174 domain-containing protein [Pseudomonadota bacterium]